MTPVLTFAPFRYRQSSLLVICMLSVKESAQTDFWLLRSSFLAYFGPLWLSVDVWSQRDDFDHFSDLDSGVQEKRKNNCARTQMLFWSVRAMLSIFGCVLGLNTPLWTRFGHLLLTGPKRCQV